MKLDIYYSAYQKKLHIGNLFEQDNKVIFNYDKSFDSYNINILPNYKFQSETINSDDTRLPPSLFWDLLPTGYNAETLYKITNNSVYQIPVSKRLGLNSKRTIGAIEFEPSISITLKEKPIDLDQIEDDIQSEKNLSKVYQLLASINGHTPKIVASVTHDKKAIFETKNDNSCDEWIIKLPSSHTNPKDGLAEYVYSQMAKIAGIEVPEFHLFKSTKCAGYFGSKRFDRDGKNKIHTLSVGALANKYYLNEPIYIADYINVVKNIAPQDLKSLLKILIFNIKTGNNDIRGTNISFILKDDTTWALAPAYDLVPFSLENIYTPKMLQKGYDKNEEDGKIYDICELADFDFNEVASLIDETENAIGEYHSLIQNIYG